MNKSLSMHDSTYTDPLYVNLSFNYITKSFYPLRVFNLFRLNECHYNEIQFKFARSPASRR